MDAAGSPTCGLPDTLCLTAGISSNPWPKGEVVNEAGRQQLERLRTDYQSVVGRPFEHFFCPILFRDEAAALCRGHVINTAFRDSDPTWTIQRADVDSFYGRVFESKFLAIQAHGEQDILIVLTDKELRRHLKPKILLEGREVEHYVARGPVPPHFSELQVELPDGKTVKLAMKLEPSEALASRQDAWEIAVERDVLVAALPSLLKAAHLTWFELMGYRYAMSLGGHFLGHHVLGAFYFANAKKSKRRIIESAEPHFREFVNLVRPLASPQENLKGTITDKQCYLCTGSAGPWAILTLIKTGKRMHGVLVPVLESAEAAARFLAFLKEPAPCIEVRLTRFTGALWEVAKRSVTFSWPAAKAA